MRTLSVWATIRVETIILILMSRMVTTWTVAVGQL